MRFTSKTNLVACQCLGCQQRSGCSAGWLSGAGSSSAAIAAMLGYEDGEEMSFDELFYVVSRIKTVSELPLSVDLEAGYGATTSHIIDNIRRLAHLGVSGINLEDSHVVDGTRRLDDAERFAVKLQEITRACPGLFVNVRTDTFLLNVQDALVQTLYRGQLYAKHGACGFLCLASPARRILPPSFTTCLYP